VQFLSSSDKKPKRFDPNKELLQVLEPIINDLKMSLIEMSVYRGKAKGKESCSMQIRVVVFAAGKCSGITSIDDCSRVHRRIMSELELIFPGQNIGLEVSSPGINRIIKNSTELIHYIGREIKCYRTDISGWTAGILISADKEKIVLNINDEEITLPISTIGKAKLG
jgi:ribosome maturation factor RimP